MNKLTNTKNINNFSSEGFEWKQVQNEMKNKLGLEVYESWLKKISFVEEFNNYLLLSVPTRFIRDWITSRYLDQILKIIKVYKKDIIRIEFKIVEKAQDITLKENNIKENNTNENVSFIKDSYLQYNRIDPNKRFDNFITGSSNKLAYEASLKVSENISHYNPLYIYGGVGMGKTHLLNSIGLELKKNNKVMFISAERFMYQFVKSIKSNDMVKFKEYFRNTDILLIDDIQFISGKEAMQEEFFHTFNALLDKGSQIIVSADRSPNKLSRIQERIKSRFSGGLVVDIQKPDLELRKKIVEKKTEELNALYSEQLQVSREIQDFISNEITGSVRELVGAINRVVSFSRIYNKVPNLAETKVVLKDLLNLAENKVTIDLIQTIVCKFFKISKNEMLSSRRSRYLVRPRQTAIYLTKILTSKSLPEIGREFSNRDHTTIIHSVKTIEKIKEKDPEMVDNINKLKNQIFYIIIKKMKFNVNQQDLQQALNYCQGVIEKRSTLPILSNILLDASNSKLTITATDLDLIFIHQLNNVEILEEGKTTTTSSIMYDIIRKFNSGKKINLSLTDISKLQVESEKSIFNLNCISATEFPLTDENFNQNEFIIKSKQLLKLLNKCKFSVSNDETRHYLSGFIFIKQKLKIKII